MDKSRIEHLLHRRIKMNKEKLKKGTFSGVIPMMGLFVMAALMGFQSIPISQSISQELTDSFSDLSRISQTKSHAGFHFYNYIPTGTEYSVNEKSYDLAKEGGNVSWNYNQFDIDTDRGDKVESMTKRIVKDNLEPAAGEYLNAKYSSTAGGQNCITPDINYTAKLLPDAGTDFIEEVDQFPDDIPVTVRSEVDVTSSGTFGWFNTVSAAPVEVTCGDNEHGSAKYIGDSSTSTLTFFSDFSSVGYSNELNATANRFHILAKETTQFYKTLYDDWTSVQSVTNTKQSVCDPSNSDWESLEQRTVNDMNNEVTTPYNEAKDQVDVSGFTKNFSIKTYELNFEYDDYDKKFDGNSTNRKVDVGNCKPHTHSCGEDCSYTHYHADVYDLYVTVNAKKSVVSSNVTDTEYKVITEEGWDNIEFLVDSYPHEFYKDE